MSSLRDLRAESLDRTYLLVSGVLASFSLLLVVDGAPASTVVYELGIASFFSLLAFVDLNETNRKRAFAELMILLAVYYAWRLYV